MVVLAVMLLGVGVYAQRGGGRGGGPSPEQRAALAKQEELEKATPRLQVTEEVLNLVVPGHTIGEAVGVAKDSKGHLYVFTRSGNAGPAKGATSSQLFEFDQNLKFVKQWGPDNYAASFAHTVRVDKQDNVWMTDEGANMIVKFNPPSTTSSASPNAARKREKRTATLSATPARSIGPPTSPGIRRATFS